MLMYRKGILKEWSNIIYHRIKSPFIGFCIRFGITTIHISLINHFITLTFGCYFFSRGTYGGMLMGLGICLVNGFLDYLDGDVARITNNQSKLGAWLDAGFDIIIQFAVMGAIAIGCAKQGIGLVWIVLFFVALGANNFVSFNYNQTFGFDSDKGNALFRELMDRKSTQINIFLKNMIDPTSGYFPLFLYTFRYWIAIGSIFNIMPILFIAITLIGNLKWAVMYSIFALHQAESKKLYVLHVLAALDEEREDFYELRSNS